MNQKVVSREYKLLLYKDLFIGDEQQVLKKSQEFWHDFSQAINSIVIGIKGDLDGIEDRRIIRFYDTDEYIINSNSYILRERQDVTNDEREITLKFRHPDRYISQDREMNTGKPKFEEDIKAPFGVLYSFSDTQKILITKKLNKMEDAANLYPDLVDKLSSFKEEENIRIIGVTICELVVKGAKFQIRQEPRLDSNCALIIWYQNDGDRNSPVAVEFSFKYEDENERYTRKLAQRAYDVFSKLEKLEPWVDLNSDTKTAYIYKLDALLKQAETRV
ncbi:MAG: hypothetical protein PUP90_07135 [Nostoc sp. S4]|nr:hypothetical protein [Nostoc sp. S4]